MSEAAVTKADLNEMLKDTLSPTRTQIRMVTATQDHKIQAGLQSLDYYKCKMDKNAIVPGKDKVSADDIKKKENWGRILYRILLFFVDNGSSPMLKVPASTYIFVNVDKFKKDEYAAVLANEVLLVVKVTTDFPRRWTRRYADQIFEYIGHHDYNPGLAVKWGVPPLYKQVAYDFADALSLSKIKDAKMLVCLTNTVASNIAKSIKEEDAALTQASHLYHQGQIMRPGRMSRLLQ